MFNIGFSEFLAIGVIALIVIGPKQLPQVARVVGRVLGEIKKATEDLSGGLLEVTHEVKSSIEETRDQVVQEANDLLKPINEEQVADSQRDELEGADRSDGKS